MRQGSGEPPKTGHIAASPYRYREGGDTCTLRHIFIPEHGTDHEYSGELFMKRENTQILPGLVIACLACLLVGCAAAQTVTTQVTQVRPGDPVSVELRDIPDNATFLLRITGTFTVTPGGDFSFSADTFQMPFSLLQSQVRASLQNTDINVLSVKKGDVEVRKTGRSQGGSYATAENANISSGTYEFLRLSGTALPGADQVIANLELTGMKSGADSGTISFTVGGIQSGTVAVSASVDGNPVLSTTVAVVPAVTPTPTSGTGSYTGGGGGGGGGGGAALTTTQPTTLVTTSVPVENMTITMHATAAGTTVTTANPTAEQTPVPTTPVNTPTKSAMSVLPLLGLVIAAVFLANRTRK